MAGGCRVLWWLRHLTHWRLARSFEQAPLELLLDLLLVAMVGTAVAIWAKRYCVVGDIGTAVRELSDVMHFEKRLIARRWSAERRIFAAEFTLSVGLLERPSMDLRTSCVLGNR